MVEFSLNLSVKSLNSQVHWAKRYLQNKKNSKILRIFWLSLKQKPKAPCVVTIERIYNPSKQQKKYDSDNFIGAMKNVRDTIASLIIPGLAPGQADDEKHGIEWEYKQTVGKESIINFKIKKKDVTNNTAS